MLCSAKRKQGEKALKNYLGFFIILFLLIAMIATSVIQFNMFSDQLLTKAYELKNAPKDKIESVYNNLKENFQKKENVMMMFINQSSYKELYRCLIRVEYDIKFERGYNLNIDIDELIFYLEEIIEGEKSQLNNIF